MHHLIIQKNPIRTLADYLAKDVSCEEKARTLEVPSIYLDAHLLMLSSNVADLTKVRTTITLPPCCMEVLGRIYISRDSSDVDIPAQWAVFLTIVVKFCFVAIDICFIGT